LTKVQGRIGIDQNASIIEEKHCAQDKASAVNKGIGTTGRGVGPALEERVRRTAKLAKDIPELKAYITDQVQEVNDGLDQGKKVLLEGTQGFMLSLFLGGGYPYVTGRDTGASAIASEAGVGPTRVDDVLIVYKSFITRVGAGPLPGEITKEEAQKILELNQSNLNKAEEESRKIIEQSRSFAEKLKEQMLLDTKQQSRKLLEDASAEIERKKDEAFNDLKNQIAEIAINAAEKILNENLNKETQKKIVDKYLGEIAKN